MSKIPPGKKPQPGAKPAASQKRTSFRLSAFVEACFIPMPPDGKLPFSNIVPRNKWIRGSITDLSEGGLRLTGPLAVGENLHIAVIFQLPSAFLKEFVTTEDIREIGPFGERMRTVEQREDPFAEMEVQGKIIKQAVNSESKVFQYHVAFAGVEPEVKSEIARFITLMQRWQLKHRNHLKNS